MLVEQTAINLAGNVLAAACGLINVIVFTRLFAPAEYGTYVLGIGFAGILCTFLSSWMRLPILREQARADETDIRGIIAPGVLASALLAPLGYMAARPAGLTGGEAIAAIALAIALVLFETGQEILRARLRAFTVLKAIALRALLLPALGTAFAMIQPSGILLLASSALAYLFAAFAFTAPVWRGTKLTFDAARLLRYAKAGLPLTLSLSMLALSSVIDRFIIAHLVGPAAAGQYTANVDLVRQVLIIPAVSASAAFVPMAVKILANQGRAAVAAHLAECCEFLLALALPACASTVACWK